jgi:hypothetical protein
MIECRVQRGTREENFIEPVIFGDTGWPVDT